MTCNATLTTLTPTGELSAHMPRQGIGTTPLYDSLIPDGATVTRDGDRLLRADVTVVTCDESQTHDPCTAHGRPCREHINADGVVWCDDTKGATPHRDPMDELVAVSQEAGLYDDPCPDCGAAMSDHAEGQHPGTADSIRELLTDTRSVERRHVDAAVDALAAEGVPMLDRDRLARAALDAAWRKAPWDMPGTRPTVTEDFVDHTCEACWGGYGAPHTCERFRRGGTRPQSSEAKSYAVEVCPTVTDDLTPRDLEALAGLAEALHADFCGYSDCEDGCLTLAEKARAVARARPSDGCDGTRPAVSDAEIDAALEAVQGPDNGQRSAIVRALHAAARARQENHNE